MKTISYAITVKDEYDEVKRLLRLLLVYKRECDEIVVLIDRPELHPANMYYDMEIEEIINMQGIHINIHQFAGDFAAHKNYLNSKCTKDYIFQIDADEYPSTDLLTVLPQILELNENDLYFVPRVNTVTGITSDYIKLWNWSTQSIAGIDEPTINFPDYQARIYKNSPDIKWKNKVHEVITGHKTLTMLQPIPSWSLYHPQSLEKQIKQYNLYAGLTRK